MDGALNCSAALISVVRSALTGLGAVGLEEVRTRSWKSASFRGARHELVLQFEGPEAMEMADRFLWALADTDLDTPGHVVADVDLVAVERRPERTRLRLEVLTVEA